MELKAHLFLIYHIMHNTYNLYTIHICMYVVEQFNSINVKFNTIPYSDKIVKKDINQQKNEVKSLE